MNDPQPTKPQTVYEYWSQTVMDVLAWQMEFVETQRQVGHMLVEAALQPARASAPVAGPSAGKPSIADELQRLEALAIERVRKGLALPRDLYSVPYRNRVDWSRFPEWARPIDPELFEDSGHEG
jgi:hypothetical protein